MFLDVAGVGAGAYATTDQRNFLWPLARWSTVTEKLPFAGATDHTVSVA